MNFNDAKNTLKQGYLKKGLEFVDENEDLVHLKSGNTVYTITTEDIREYSDFENRRSDFEVTPIQTSMCSKEYREQPISIESFGMINPKELNHINITCGKTSKEDIFVEISPPSKDFFNFFRFEKIIGSYYRPKLDATEDEEINDIRELFPNLITIKVHNLSASKISDAVKKSETILRNCIFQLSYLKGIPIVLRVEWVPIGWRRLPRPFKPFTIGNLPLTDVNFIPDLIRFYVFGISSNIAETKYLAFYQVLEYFFILTSNEKVYEKLSNKIKDPKFNLSNTSLDAIVQIVTKHRQETDETAMLKNVLNKFIDPKELIDFIRQYEKFLNKQAYSKPHTIFGESIQINLEPGHVIGNIAKQIKEIRNALVHSSDRFERKTRHIPFTKTTELIKQDIPLLKFLAEKVIIASAT